MCSGTRYCDIADNFSGLMRCLGDKRISDSRRGYFALGCCDRAYGGLKRRFGDENLALNPPQNQSWMSITARFVQDKPRAIQVNVLTLSIWKPHDD